MRAYIYKSTKDAEPPFVAQNLMKAKEDVRERLVSAKKEVLEKTEKDTHHSIGYYRTVERLFDEFILKVENTPLPMIRDEWWYYSFQIDSRGIALNMNYLNNLDFLLNDDGEVVSTGMGSTTPFTLITAETKRLTVEEYAKYYDVEPVTVRQWIRRCKIRTAVKEGKEWRIPELTDVPHRKFDIAEYFVDHINYGGDHPDIGLPEEYRFLEEAQRISIEQNKDGKDSYTIKIYTYSYMSPAKQINITGKERERLEFCLISNPHFHYQQGSYDFSTKGSGDIRSFVWKIAASGRLDLFGDSYTEVSSDIEYENLADSQ